MFMDWVVELTERTLRETAASIRNGRILEGPKVAGADYESALKLVHGTQTVLLVDDETSLLEVLSELLSSQGYRVLPAGSGEAAMSICHQYAGRIDVLVTDVDMRPVNGFELAATVKSARPEVFIVLISGTPDNFGKTDIADQFLQKPFDHKELLTTISRCVRRAE
jgi:DNA-binding response OmpR family regulator